MIVVLSGEGPTDIGRCSNQQNYCSIPDFNIGPMALVIDKIIEGAFGYSPLNITPDRYRYLSKQALVEKEALRKQEKRKVSFTGRKRDEETGYFYINAWMLAEIAKEVEQEEGDQSLAILFRDCDGTNSSPPDLWLRKWNSMMSGFSRANFHRGVPMLPRPKSEAWLLCAAKTNPYQHCAALEDLPGNDDSPNAAKQQLSNQLEGHTSAAQLNEWLNTAQFNYEAVAAQMASFGEFHRRLLAVLSSLTSQSSVEATAVASDKAEADLA